MNLRARVLAGLGVLLVVLVALGVGGVLVGRSQLMAQLDEQLRDVPLPPSLDPNLGPAPGLPPPPAGNVEGSAVPSPRGTPPPDDSSQPMPPGVGPAPGGVREPPVLPPIGDPPAMPVSDLFIAVVHPDGTVQPIISGTLLGAVPRLYPPEVAFTDSADGSPEAASVSTVTDASEGAEFRLLVRTFPDNRKVLVAKPQAATNQTMGQLLIGAVAALGLLAVGLVFVGWWVLKLGIAPILEMTRTADAITDGQREVRARPQAEGTEAARLATALNQMLDERDASEHRLRQFVADASHELRTPLTSIGGYLDVYSSGGFRDEGQLDDVVRRMRQESTRMQNLVEELLLLAQLDEKQGLRVGPVDVGLLLADTAKDALAVHPDLDITVEVPADQALVIEGDAGRIQQVTLGLVNNAVKHTPPGTAVTLVGRWSPTGLEITVKDNGPGLPAGVAGRVFDRFYRGDSARTRSTGGSGLGLAIARSIVRAHGGELSLTTELGDGCEFAVRLPGAAPA